MVVMERYYDQEGKTFEDVNKLSYICVKAVIHKSCRLAHFSSTLARNQNNVTNFCAVTPQLLNGVVHFWPYLLIRIKVK